MCRSSTIDRGYSDEQLDAEREEREVQEKELCFKEDALEASVDALDERLGLAIFSWARRSSLVVRAAIDLATLFGDEVSECRVCVLKFILSCACRHLRMDTQATNSCRV